MHPDFTVYAYTVTLQPKYYDFMPKEQVDLILNDLNSVSQYVDMDMRFELTEKGNIHAHGVVQLKRIIYPGYSQMVQIKSMFRNRIKYKIGFVKVEDIHDMAGWYTYCTKDEHIFHTQVPNNTIQHMYSKIMFTGVKPEEEDKENLERSSIVIKHTMVSKKIETTVEHHGNVKEKVKKPKKIRKVRKSKKEILNS